MQSKWEWNNLRNTEFKWQMKMKKITLPQAMVSTNLQSTHLKNISQIGNLPQIGGGKQIFEITTLRRTDFCSLFFIAPKIEVGYLSKHVKQLENSTTYISKSKKRKILSLLSIHVWYISLHVVDFMTNVDVGNYTKHGWYGSIFFSTITWHREKGEVSNSFSLSGSLKRHLRDFFLSFILDLVLGKNDEHIFSKWWFLNLMVMNTMVESLKITPRTKIIPA